MYNIIRDQTVVGTAVCKEIAIKKALSLQIQEFARVGAATDWWIIPTVPTEETLTYLYNLTCLRCECATASVYSVRPATELTAPLIDFADPAILQQWPVSRAVSDSSTHPADVDLPPPVLRATGSLSGFYIRPLST